MKKSRYPISSYIRPEIKKCFRCLALYPLRSIWIVCLMIAAAVTEIIGISVMIPILDYIQYGHLTHERASLLSKSVAKALLAFGIDPSIGHVLAIVVCIAAVQFGVVALQAAASAKLFLKIRETLRNKAFDALLEMSPEFHSSQKSGALVEIIHNQVTQLGEAIKNLIAISTYLLILLVYSGFLICLSWQLTLMMIAISFFKFLLSNFFAHRAHRFSKKVLALSKEHMVRLIETFQAVFLIKSLSREDYEKKRYRKVHGDLEDTKIQLVYNDALHLFFDKLIMPVTLSLIVFVSISVLQVSGTLTLVYIAALIRVFGLHTLVSQGWVNLSSQLPGVAAVDWVQSSVGKHFVTDGPIHLLKFSKSIEIKNLKFSYSTGSEILHGINLSIRRGEHIAIVGPSGGGKTTLISLLLRLFDPASGMIEVDGTDLRNCNRAAWHRLIGFVGQDTFIFNDTVFENIRYGNLEATEVEVLEAAENARAMPFINKMEKGIHTVVGDRGTRLSGGERQRIAIARAFLRNPQILLMDEATSALDSVTEKMIEDSTVELSKSRTAIVIAHRLSTIQGADRIIVLENGRIVQEGTHEGLLKNSSLYIRYHELQSMRGLEPSQSGLNLP